MSHKETILAAAKSKAIERRKNQEYDGNIKYKKDKDKFYNDAEPTQEDIIQAILDHLDN